MQKIIKDDILAVLRNAITALKTGEYDRLRALSDHTIQDAGIYQEDDPLTLAVVMYAIAKIIQRCKDQGKNIPRVFPTLELAYDYLKNNDENGYRAEIKRLLKIISVQDEEIRIYTQEVIEKAKIKKGSKIHQHGISISRTAELLGISQWELQQYIGQFKGDGAAKNLPKRLQHARRLFN